MEKPGAHGLTEEIAILWKRDSAIQQGFTAVWVKMYVHLANLIC